MGSLSAPLPAALTCWPNTVYMYLKQIVGMKKQVLLVSFATLKITYPRSDNLY
jgi:hypothetical protein